MPGPRKPTEKVQGTFDGKASWSETNCLYEVLFLTQPAWRSAADKSKPRKYWDEDSSGRCCKKPHRIIRAEVIANGERTWICLL